MSAIAFPLPDEIESLCDGIEAFVEAEVIDRHERHRDLLEDQRQVFDDTGRYSERVIELIREVRMASAKAGFFNMCVPEDLGGAGMGMLAYYACWERVFHRCGPKNWLSVYAISHWAFGPSVVLRQLTEQAQEQILAGMMRGETSMCFGMSEPGAGSDVANLQTKAIADGEGWRINGRKIWTTNSPHADYCVVFAITDLEAAQARRGGISAFIVDTSDPGFHIESIIRMFGEIGGHEASIVLEDVRAQPYQLVGELNDGFKVGILGVSLGRIYNSARSVGYARWSIELALEYAKTREAFGHRIADYQGVTFPLAESAMEVHAAHLMGINAAMLLDSGNRAIKELSMAKSYSVEVGVKAVDRAMQTHGAMGFTNEVGLTEAWKSLRQVNVADGTNEILRRTIANRLLSGDLEL